MATAKRDLHRGEELDGEGGFRVYGKLMSAKKSLEMEALPIGLAHGMVLRNEVSKGEIVRWSDVWVDEGREDVGFRREMEGGFRGVG